ncbi:MAG: efflux RND transporter periplasmic adaptor subunit [Alphaproteobacteria bacterium]|nr:efflux RND transporter periplasmic adaptor subunit [Alphaproteobacteria bacterium]
MKTLLALILLGVLAAAGWYWHYGLPIDPHAGHDMSATAPEPAAGRRVLYYRNPMGLPDISPLPKKDSMGMDYIPVYADEAAEEPGVVRIAVERVQRAGVRTEAVGRHVLSRAVSAVGIVALDEARQAIVTAKFGGFIEELHVPVSGVEVRAGQPLLRVWIESNEILQKQADFLTALRGGTSRSGDPERTERNLRLFGFPDSAIESLRRTGEPVRSIVVTAPLGGTVIEKPALVGMRFAAGESLFRIIDHSRVWVIAQVAERDLAAVAVGHKARVTLTGYPDEAQEGRVALIFPELDAATRTARLRIELPNPSGRIHIGLYAEVEIESPQAARPVLAVPEAAVLDSGRRRVAFVALGEGRFEARELILGRRGGGLIEVRKGLAEGEQVVTRGNFLIDAESNLRSALGGLTDPGSRP